MDLQKIISQSNNIVFFGGAGVSTESGIPDFRSVDGLYSQKFSHPPEVMLSYSFFKSHTDEFYTFYKTKMLHLNAKPNKAHVKLAELEKHGKLKAVITQNVDGLHQLAGSQNVIEIHGSAHRNYCVECKRKYGVEAITESAGIPKCECGGVIRPDVVLYEEQLNMSILNQAAHAIQKADVLIVGGTSLNVYPAAGLVNYYRGGKFVLINKSSTPMDTQANLIINDSIGETLGKII
jgi:NAD-dependent deacetylase